MRALGLLACLALAAPAQALDVPLAGASLSVRTKADAPDKRKLTWKTERSPDVAAPLPDPSAGASLQLFTSNAQGHCSAVIDLPASYWEGKKGDGESRGWIYKDRSGSAGGVRKVQVTPGRKGGRLIVMAKGALPCALEAEAQAEPFEVVLRVGGTRWCTRFGGTVKKNELGAFKAKAAPAAACPDADVTVATLNVLHGLLCPSETEGCRLVDRLDLLGQWLALRECPDVVALQEVNAVGAFQVAVLAGERLADVCAGRPYEVLFLETNRVDDSLLLVQHPVLAAEALALHGGFRNLLWARLDHPMGAVDVAFTEASVGAGVSTVLVVAALFRTTRRSKD